MRNPIQLVKDSVSLIKDNPALFLGILLVPAVLSVIAALFEPAQDTGVVDAMEWIMFALVTVVVVIANIFMGIALILALSNRSLTVKEACSASTAFFWRYLGLSILTSLAITIGFVLLIVPGIILSVWLTFAVFILVLERAEIIESMKKSKEYVKGKWWAVFGRLVAGSLLAFFLLAILFAVIRLLALDVSIENMIMSFLSMLIAPIAFGYMYLMYQDVKGTPTIPTATPSATSFTPEAVVTSPSEPTTTT